MSGMYALVLFVVGALFYLTDVLVIGDSAFKLTTLLNLYLCVGGIVWLTWLIVDIRMYTRMMKRFAAKEEASSGESFMDKFKLEMGPDGEYIVSVPLAAETQVQMS